MTDREDAYLCEICGLAWNNNSSAERCCEDDDLTGYEPSRGRISYIPGYD